MEFYRIKGNASPGITNSNIVEIMSEYRKVTALAVLGEQKTNPGEMSQREM
jgi:hypothetical protein